MAYSLRTRPAAFGKSSNEAKETTKTKTPAITAEAASKSAKKAANKQASSTAKTTTAPKSTKTFQKTTKKESTLEQKAPAKRAPATKLPNASKKSKHVKVEKSKDLNDSQKKKESAQKYEEFKPQPFAKDDGSQALASIADAVDSLEENTLSWPSESQLNQHIRFDEFADDENDETPAKNHVNLSQQEIHDNVGSLDTFETIANDLVAETKLDEAFEEPEVKSKDSENNIDEIENQEKKTHATEIKNDLETRIIKSPAASVDTKANSFFFNQAKPDSFNSATSSIAAPYCASSTPFTFGFNANGNSSIVKNSTYSATGFFQSVSSPLEKLCNLTNSKSDACETHPASSNTLPRIVSSYPLKAPKSPALSESNKDDTLEQQNFTIQTIISDGQSNDFSAAI